ncbi:hypothetical protein PAMP_001073 [Pampus punctatissimus]
MDLVSGFGFQKACTSLFVTQFEKGALGEANVDSKSRRFSESLVLDDSEKGVIITGITDDTIAAKSGLQAGDEIVAATIHLDHLNKNEVLNILKVLEPYDNNMKVLTKKELSASASLSSLGLGLTGRAENLDASAEAPVVSLEGLSGKLNAVQALQGEISGPTLNGDLPSLSLNKPSADAGAKFTMPSLGLTGPDVKGDLDGTLKAPNVTVSTPSLYTPSASYNIEKPEITTGNITNKVPIFTMPQFNLPQLETPKANMDVSGNVALPSVRGNLETPGLDLSAPKIDLKSPDLDLNGPKVDLNGPDVNLETPNADISAPSGKFKWPHLNWKGPKVKGPDADLNADLSAPDNLSTKKIEGDLRAPDVDIHLPEVDIEGPNLDIQTPTLDTDAPSGKINWPHLKWKKPKLHGSKPDLDLDANLNAPDVDLPPKVEGGINGPDVDINLLNTELKTPDLDIQSPNIDVEPPSGKINWPHLKWKKPKLQTTKADVDIDADLNTPDLSLSTPQVKGDMNVPNAELNLPQADLKGPDIDVQYPDIDIDATSGKINWPHLKWKKPKLHGPKADLDLNADLNTPDIDISVLKTEGEISTPHVDMNLPKADVEAPSGKIRFPTLKKPKFLFSGPKGKAPDVDLDDDVKAPDLSLSTPNASLDGPEVDLNLPNANVDVETPDVDIEGPSGKSKWPTLKKPKWLVSRTKVNGPDVDLDSDVSAPALNLSAPKTDSEIHVPDVNLNLPNADMEEPKLDINGPEVEGPSGKFKWFNFKKPKVGTLKGPKADIDGNVKVPDVDLNGPDVDLSAPDINLSAPKIDGGTETPDLNINMTNADVKGPDVDLNGPDFDLNSPDGKLKLPKLKLPKWPKVKGPELDADLKAPSTDASPEFPKVDVDAPNVDLKTPDYTLSEPKVETGLDVPDLGLSDASEVDASAGKFKLPKIKIPKFGLSGPRVKGPNVDVDAGLKGPDLNLSPPDVDAKLPKADLKGDDVNLNSPDLNLSAPKIEGGIAAPDLSPDATVPDIELLTADVKTPNLKFSVPTVKGDLNLPKVGTDIGIDVNIPSGKLQAPSLDLPNLNLSGPKVKIPDLDAENEANISLPEFDLPTPKIKGPDVDLDLPKADMKAPSLDLSLSSPKIDGNLSAPNTDTKLPTANVTLDTQGLKLSSSDIKGDVAGSNFDINLPKAELKGPDAQLKTPDLNFDSYLGDIKFPHFKLPTFGISNPEVEVSSVYPSVEAPKVNIGTPTADANISVPTGDCIVPKLEGDITGPNLNISPDGKIKLLDVSATAPEVKASLNAPRVDITAGGDAEVKGSPKSKLRWPFKWGFMSSSVTDEEGSGTDSETDVSNAEVEVPLFKLHKLPKNTIDDIGGIGDTFGLSKLDTEAKDYIISKGIRLPVVNSTSKPGEKIDIMARLKMAKNKVSSTNVSPTKVKNDIDLKFAAPSLEVSASPKAGDSLVRGVTFNEKKTESALGLVAPAMSTSDENDKLSLSLSNMLCLNIKDSDAD